MSDIQEEQKRLYKRAEENDIKLLQEEIEELREDNYAYHQLMKMENEREYRSKFLKEFQEEFGKNVFPDYDEIYKRYDKLKKENKKLKELCDKYEEEHSTAFELWKNSLLEKKNLQKEIERLNNIIDELEKWLKKEQDDKPFSSVISLYNDVLDKLNKLKGDNK